ncbi:FAD-dependent monooxygenase [Nitrospira sp. Nam74]
MPLDDLLKLPHQKASQINGIFDGFSVTVADFSPLPVRCPYIAFMPQWDFLNFLAGQASRYPTFTLRMEGEVSELFEQDGRVVAVRARKTDGEMEVHTGLVVGADGRHSVVRTQASLRVDNLGVPMDVLCFRLSRAVEDPDSPVGRFESGRIFIMLNRGDY